MAISSLSNRQYERRIRTELEARLAVHDEVAVVLPEAAAVVVVDGERGVVVRDEEVARDVVPGGDGRGRAVTQRRNVRGSIPAAAVRESARR